MKHFTLKCEYCGKVFNRTKHNMSLDKNIKHRFCSMSCKDKFQIKRKMVICKNCGKSFEKKNNEVSRTKNNFCSHSCAATYNNTHKTKGTRTSKLEIWLQEQLRTLYPDEKILFNDKTAINSELDIYFPRLKLAFELNGIFHYEPIFGEKKLDQIQNNDQRKFLLCQQKNISLCVLDVSKEKYFKEVRSKKYLDIIKNVLAEAVRFARTNPIKD